MRRRPCQAHVEQLVQASRILGQLTEHDDLALETLEATDGLEEHDIAGLILDPAPWVPEVLRDEAFFSATSIPLSALRALAGLALLIVAVVILVLFLGLDHLINGDRSRSD